MTQKSKTILADLLRMPDEDDMEIDFERAEIKLDEAVIDELVKEFSEENPPKPQP